MALALALMLAALTAMARLTATTFVTLMPPTKQPSVSRVGSSSAVAPSRSSARTSGSVRMRVHLPPADDRYSVSGPVQLLCVTLIVCTATLLAVEPQLAAFSASDEL